MPAYELSKKAAERVWGRRGLPASLMAARSDNCIGEIWFTDTATSEAELLVKYIFTSERLSIQVHPDDAAAQKRGFARGKDEAWYIIDAEPGAVIGLGLKRMMSSEELCRAALDGSIEDLIDWRPVDQDNFFYSPAGTVHAIGAGLSLVEIQQNLDLTYRLYDYGRPRELHLDEGVSVADPAPWNDPFERYEHSAGREILAAGAAFVLERWTFAGAANLHSHDAQLQLVPLKDGGLINGHPLTAGSVWRVSGSATLDADNAIELLAAYPGAAVRPDICVAI